MIHENINKYFLICLIVLFCVFLVLLEKVTYNKYTANVHEHANVIKDALWNLDPQGPVEYLKGWCILRLVERQGADLTKYGEIRDSLHQVLLNNKQRELFSSWYIDLIAAANIEDYIDEFFTNR